MLVTLRIKHLKGSSIDRYHQHLLKICHLMFLRDKKMGSMTLDFGRPVSGFRRHDFGRDDSQATCQ